MSRWEFMRQLEQLLVDISPNEREAALQYYNDYFNDAGTENEQEVIEALGSPEQVAQIVKDGLAENDTAGEFTEKGFASGAGNVQNELIRGAQAAKEASEQSEDADSMQQEDRKNKKKDLPTWAIVLLVIAAVLFSPIWISLLIVAVSVVVSLFAGVFSLIVSFAAATLILYVVAIALVVAGVACMVSQPIVGLGLAGAGLICGALGVLFMLLMVLLFGKGIPALCTGIAYIWNRIFKKKGGVTA